MFHTCASFIIFIILEPFNVWADGFVAKNVALMMCLAINGYHGVVDYKWRKEGNNEIIETTPLFF